MKYLYDTHITRITASAIALGMIVKRTGLFILVRQKSPYWTLPRECCALWQNDKSLPSRIGTTDDLAHIQLHLHLLYTIRQ